MNARFALKESPSDLGRHFGLTTTDNFPARYNIAPSQPAPIILHERGVRQYQLVRWGFVPSWDRDGAFFKKAQVNIRAETAHEKPMFRHAWRRRHCLFPLNGYYEWREEGGVKQPYFVALAPDAPVFSVAGLYEDWLGADGSEIRSAAFLTRPSVGALKTLHHRSPVMVKPCDHDRWLMADELDDSPSWEIVHATPAEFCFWPVDRKVGSWKAQGSDLMAPIDKEPPGSKEAKEPENARLI